MISGGWPRWPGRHSLALVGGKRFVAGGTGGVAGQRIDHPVDVVAVDPVDPHAEESVEHPVVLGVPAEGEHPEAMEQGAEATAPVRVVQVHRLHPFRLEAGTTTFGSLLDARS